MTAPDAAQLDVFLSGTVFLDLVFSATLAGWPLDQQIKFGNLLAGLSVRHHSGSLGAPSWGEIADWLGSPDVPARVRAEYGFVVPHIPDPAVHDVVRARPTIG